MHTILNNCTEVLNEKYFFVEDIKIVEKPNGHVIAIRFDPRTSKLPKLFNGVVQDNQNGHANLYLYVMSEGTMETLLERAIDIYIWACCLPGKGSREYVNIMYGDKREVKADVANQ